MCGGGWGGEAAQPSWHQGRCVTNDSWRLPTALHNVHSPLNLRTAVNHTISHRNQYGSNELVAELAASQEVFAQPALDALTQISKTVRRAGGLRWPGSGLGLRLWRGLWPELCLPLRLRLGLG